MTPNNAKIVCTLGPASDSREIIEALSVAGMAVARFNASHGSPAHRAELIDRVHAVDEATRTPLAAMMDLAGPEVRTAPLEESIHVVAGSQVRFVEGEHATPEEIGLSTAIGAVEPGDRVLLDDGRIETTVERVESEEDRNRERNGDDDGGREEGEDGDGKTVIARVDAGGDLGGRKGVNIPGVDLGLDPVTEADRRDIRVAAEREADFVAASFVRDAEDVYTVNEHLERHDADIPVIAKIERADAVENIDSIVDAAYGVMIARGDLGVECPMEEVPVIQKRIIRTCHRAGVPVITATEMLDSMIHERRPTRAETSDVANAVLDGTDAVMLSGETAIGDHPVRVVEAMDRIVGESERSGEYADRREGTVPQPGESRTDVLARAARYLARDTDASAVVAATESGYTALKASKYRPDVPIVGVTPDAEVQRRLALSWGVVARHAPLTGPGEGIDRVLGNAVRATVDAGVVETGETVVVLAGLMTELEGADTTNMLKLHVAAETLATGRSVVDGHATGPLYRITDTDLADLPDGAVLVLPENFDGEFAGDTSAIGGIVDPGLSMTGYPAVVARELDVPMSGEVSLPDTVADGTTVTLDAERGVIHEGEVATDRDRRG